MSLIQVASGNPEILVTIVIAITSGAFIYFKQILRDNVSTILFLFLFIVLPSTGLSSWSNVDKILLYGVYALELGLIAITGRIVFPSVPIQNISRVYSAVKHIALLFTVNLSIVYLNMWILLNTNSVAVLIFYSALSMFILTIMSLWFKPHIHKILWTIGLSKKRQERDF